MSGLTREDVELDGSDDYCDTLYQRLDYMLMKEWKVIAYVSLPMRKHECNYPMPGLEILQWC